jgi:hypothetical protein
MQTETTGNKDEEMSRIKKTANSSSFSLLTSQEPMTNGRLCERKRIAAIFLVRNKGYVFFWTLNGENVVFYTN